MLLWTLDAIELSDRRSPSAEAWTEAGMLPGILARKQLGLAEPKKALSAAERRRRRGRRREPLNDALLFLTARGNGAALVGSNVADMDASLRFRPGARLLLYRLESSLAPPREKPCITRTKQVH